MKNCLPHYLNKSTLLCFVFFFPLCLKAQIQVGDFQEEDDSIQIYRAQYFDEMRRLEDGSQPDIWQAFMALRQNAGSRDEVPAANWISLGPNTMDSLAGRMTCHAFNPLNTNTLLVGSAGGGLWKTTDGGDHWMPLTDDLPSLRISAVAFNPQDTNHIILGTGHFQGPSFTLQPGVGLLESFDGGDTWLPNDLAFSYANGVSITRIVWDQSNTANLFVAASNGVWVSNDTGQSWNNTLSGGVISDLEIIQANPEKLYAGMHSNGIYRSDDGGQNWVLMTNGLPASSNVHRINLAVSESAPDFALASIVNPINFGPTGLFKTSDGGDSWQLVPNAPSYLCNSNCLGWFSNVVEVSPLDTNKIILGGPRLYRTINGGQSWDWRDYYASPFGTSNVGLAYVDQWDAAYDPMHPGVVYVLNDGGVHKSTDDGFYWEKKNEGLVTGQFYRIASFPGDPNLMIGGIQDHGLHYLDNTNGNTHWNIWYIGDGCALSFDPNNPGRVYGDNLFGFHYRSNNVTGGLFATGVINNGIIGTNSVAFHFVTTHHPTESNILYTANDARIFKTNNGATWGAVADIANVRAMAISPANPSTIYAASYDSSNWAFYVSHDDGATWSQTAGAPGWRVTDVEGDPNNHGIVYATRNSFFAGNPHVYKSFDHGENWVPISDGLPDVSTWTITVNPFDEDVLYVGTDLGAFISEDGGISWAEYNDNLPPYYVMDMHYHPLDSTLRIATLGRGVWKTKSIPSSTTSTSVAEMTTSSLSVFPNPFSSNTTIEVNLVQENVMRLSVLNVLGQEISLLSAERKKQGEHHFSWNGKDKQRRQMSPGIYFIRLEINGQKLIRQIILQ